MFAYLEDYLEALAGFDKDSGVSFSLEINDKVLLSSIARQTARGVALTDRQMGLVKEKVIKYKEQLENNSILVDELNLNSLRLPLRAIDRSKIVFIKSENNKNEVVVKFPFNKKTIVLVNEISKKYLEFYRHQKGSNEHSFKFFEPILEEIVDVFSERNFFIEQQVLDIYKEIKDIKSNELKFKPMLDDDTLLNVNEKVIEIAKTEIGQLDNDNLIRYYDRSLRYGFIKNKKVEFDTYSGLATGIANRSQQKVYLPPKKYDIDQITNAISELKRFPLVVILDTNNELDQLTKIFNSIKRHVPASQQILLDRIENKNDRNYQVNSFIKDNNFATWLDNNVKVVYIFQQRLPKLLLKTDWSPITSLQTCGTRTHSHVSTYLEARCDLMLAIDDQPSILEKNSNRKSFYEIL